MLIYKNISHTTKTFHGVTFEPGQVKQVPGYINDRYFIRVNSMPAEPPKSVEKPKTSTNVSAKAQVDKKSDVPKELDTIKTDSKQNVEKINKEEIVNGTDNNK